MGILKIGGATPQLVHNFKPIRPLFCKLTSTYTYSYTQAIYCMSMKKFKDKKSRPHRRRRHRQIN